MIVSAFSFFGSLILYKITDLIIPLRVTAEQETVGLDLSQHGETALCSRLIGLEESEAAPARIPASRAGRARGRPRPGPCEIGLIV